MNLGIGQAVGTSRLRLEPLASESLSERVADRIVQALGEGRISPGDRLVEAELASALGVSRIPIREALRILQSQGIVRAVPRRGVRVIDLDENWALEVRETRIALETLCVERAARVLRSSPQALAQLDARIAALGEACKLKDRAAVNRADLALHTTLYDLSGSPVLKPLWSALARHVLIMFGMETYRYAEYGRILAQHRDLRRVLLEAGREEIAREIAQHVIGPRIASSLPTSAGPAPAPQPRITTTAGR